MILFIDISILLFIIGFMVNKTLNNDYKTEYLKFTSLITSLIITNIININFLKYYIVQLTSNFFQINKSQIDNEFFYMLSFLVQFSVIYFLIMLSIRYIKDTLLSQYSKNRFGSYYSIHKIVMIIFSFIRSIAILSILVFILESFPFDIKESENKIKISKTYSLISRLSNFIIQ